MSGKRGQSSEAVVKDIRRQTRRKFTAEEKIRIILEGLKGEASISELCRREGIVGNLYYRWSKDFLEAGKKRLRGTRCEKPVAVRWLDFVRRTNSSSSWWRSCR
jgi:transposase-like protein